MNTQCAMPYELISKCFQYINVISKPSKNFILKLQRCCWNTTSTIFVVINRICYNTGWLISFSLHTVYKGIIFGNALTLFSILKSRYKSWKKKVLIIIVKTPTLFGDKVEKEQFIFVSSPSFKFTSWHLWNKNNVYEEKN